LALSDRVPVLQVLAALRAEAGDSQQANEPLRRVAQLQPAQYNNLQRVMAAQAGRRSMTRRRSYGWRRGWCRPTWASVAISSSSIS
jgi:hypothetical protein